MYERIELFEAGIPFWFGSKFWVNAYDSRIEIEYLGIFAFII